MKLEVINWGLIDYKKAHEYQKNWVQEIYLGKRNECLIICSHPPSVTLGKKATLQDLTGWRGATYFVERGGKATYHGPEQIIVYPLLNLKNRGQNLGGLLRAMEKALIQFLKSYQIKAWGSPNNAGVWVRDESLNVDKKIASIGIAVKRWISYHGLAFNLTMGSTSFQGIKSCGHETQVMTSLSDLGVSLKDRQHAEKQLTQYLLEQILTDLPIQETSLGVANSAHS